MLTHTWSVNTIVILVTFWTVLYFFVTRKFQFWKNRKVPFIPPIPFVGNALEVFTLRKNIGEFCRKIHLNTLHPFLGFFVCDEPCLLIRDPELIKTILVKDFAFFTNRNVCDNKKADPMGSHLLFLMKNPDWRDMRRKISPVYSTAKIRTMYKLIQESGLEMVEHLDQKVAQNAVIDVRDMMSKYTTETITSTAFGIKANCFKDENSEFLQVSRRLFNFAILERGISTTCYFVAPNLVKWFRLKFVDTASADFLREVFWKTMVEREKTKIVRNDLLDILLEIKNEEDIDDPLKLEGEKVVAQATQFFIGGYETTSSTLTFMLYELALNKDIQTRLREEVQDVISNYGEISYDALKKMDFLDMCVKEVLRKYPILPFLDRRCNSNYQLPGTDLVLEKNLSVFISVLGLHYDSNNFPDPEKFDPFRFTEQNVQSRPPFTYLPFGDGPRSCIGARFANASVKSSISFIVSNFEVDLCDQTMKLLKFEPKGFLLAPDSSLFLKFKKCKRV